MRTETKHTAGPWYDYIAPHGTRHILPCPLPTLGTVQICTFNGTAHRETGETAANARLICAAPDMLAAMKNIARLQPLPTANAQDLWLALGEVTTVALDAISKAEGTT